MILDEGHMLGAGLAMTNKLQTARSLLAERRWVMTGERCQNPLVAVSPPASRLPLSCKAPCMCPTAPQSFHMHSCAK